MLSLTPPNEHPPEHQDVTDSVILEREPLIPEITRDDDQFQIIKVVYIRKVSKEQLQMLGDFLSGRVGMPEMDIRQRQHIPRLPSH